MSQNYCIQQMRGTKKKKKKRTHHKQDTNTQQLTRTDQTKTRKQPRLLKLNPLEKKERKKTQ